MTSAIMSEYKTVRKGSLGKLVTAVNAELAEGWQVQGSLLALETTNKEGVAKKLFVQAMVKPAS